MKQNSQIPLKSVNHSDGSILDVHSIFYTIQGEGPFSGYPAIFVRLAGCNLQCPGCDTEYTEGAKLMWVGEILEAIELASEKCKLIVLTGGEPFRQNLSVFIRTMIGVGYTVQIETNGTLAPHEDILAHANLHVVCSPKTGRINKKLVPFINAFKYVARYGDLMLDGLPSQALGHSAKPYLARPCKQVPVYLQPMDEQDKSANMDNMDEVVASCLAHGYILCIQTHKIVGVE